MRQLWTVVSPDITMQASRVLSRDQFKSGWMVRLGSRQSSSSIIAGRAYAITRSDASSPLTMLIVEKTPAGPNLVVPGLDGVVTYLLPVSGPCGRPSIVLCFISPFQCGAP